MEIRGHCIKTSIKSDYDLTSHLCCKHFWIPFLLGGRGGCTVLPFLPQVYAHILVLTGEGRLVVM